MKKKNSNIIKFVGFLLLMFSFNLNINAETTKIYYADSRGIRDFAAEAPTGYPNHEGGVTVTMYRYRTVTGTYKPTLYYECAVNETSDVKVFQTVACDSEESKNPEYKYQKSKTYRCVESSSDTVEKSEVIEGYKDSDGEVCKKYSEWSSASTEKPAGYDEKNTDLYQSATGTVYYWYKEVANGTTIDFTNNKVLYNAIKSEISAVYIKNAEINFIEENNTYKIVAADISKVTSLNLESMKIENIDQIGKFTGLVYLRLPENKITNIDSIKNLSNLEYLYLNYNYISSIESLVGLKKLKELDIKDNDIINLGLLKKIENYNSISKAYYVNDYKKSEIIKNWADFVYEFTLMISYDTNYSVAATNDSLQVMDNGTSLLKFEYKNNILKLISFDKEESYLAFYPLVMSITNSEYDKLSITCKDNDYNCYLSKYGDYLKLDYTYDEKNDEFTKIDMSFDLRYFYGDTAINNNPKTGVSNALILLGITLMSSAVGFVVIYKHKTGIQL